MNTALSWYNLSRRARSWIQDWAFVWCCAAGLLLANVSLYGQALTLPLETRQTDVTYNLQSLRGVPISTVATNGSDGRMPTSNESHGSVNPASSNQFQSFISFGSAAAATNIVELKNSTILQAGTNVFSPTVAQQMQLPVGLSNNVVSVVLRRAQVGAPYLSRSISFLFGSVIPVPDTDENGVTLTNIVKEQYWLPEPYSTNGHTNAGYYWSPHAQKVYAIQPGPVKVVWRKAASTTTPPPGYTTNSPDYMVSSGNYFRLFTASYVVSGSPAKKPRKMYWTEKTFSQLGKVVAIPVARVGAVNIVYNNNFPKTVSTQYQAPGESSPTDGSTNGTLQELRTLWYDQAVGGIHAYNQEGRVFVELLGDTRSDGQTRDQLGFEIVDVFKQVNPSDVTIELGERITPPNPGDVNSLSPEPVLQAGGTAYDLQYTPSGSDRLELYATRETHNLNDYMVHWMETGEVGLKWPALFGRYNLVWPSDVSKYSHYVRPLVATENEAKETAVPLSTDNVPTIQYQDPLDRPRGKFTEDYKFYTFLTPDYPAHRALLSFTSPDGVAFERVFSWLDVNLKTTNFASTVATNLDSWNAASNSFNWPDSSITPRVVSETIEVGQRIIAPVGETGSANNQSYFAGYIHQSLGNLFNPGAYIDPFAGGFDAANLGAIIPVNSIPGANKLEVWWFRNNHADTAKGFHTIYWPSVIGTYTIQWPSSPKEIVMASNKGSAGGGVNDPLVALGTIYSQNNPALPGYNPNEEHALMSGGTAYALRDDLNITNDASFSSLPFVLVNYKDSDGRPSMAVYKVLREKPEAGIYFDYIVNAGTLLQAPMPLPLLPPPTEGSGDATINYNTEPTASNGDIPVGWNDAVDSLGIYSHYKKFTYRDRKQGFWVYRGLHNGLPALNAGSYNPTNGNFGNLPAATIIAGQQFSYFVHASRQDQYLSMTAENTIGNLPAWLQISGLNLQGTPPAADQEVLNLRLIVRDLYDGSRVTNLLTLNVVTNGIYTVQNRLHILSTNSDTGVIADFSDRPPFLAGSPVPTNSFRMQFYYKTQPGFDWPGFASPPPVGSIVPYLRPVITNNTYAGDPASKNTASLRIVYRPVWPVLDPADSSKQVPTLPYGQTLTEPVNGLPGVRDFKTAYVLYQQSIATSFTNPIPSVVLHDPTRAKISALTAQSLDKLPSGIQTDFYQGRYYFPQLPPHLASRLFFDPNRGAKGSLVLQGEFKDELAGEKYVLLNVLRGSDLAAVKALCPTGDINYQGWVNLVNALSTTVETFYENPNVPGTYIPNPALNSSVGVGSLAVVGNDNIAVDSYALSATGPGNGYVTLLESSGTAFTQPGDPVSLHIFKVGGSLYTGELKPLAAPNPLSEQITLQHSGDMAGRADEYEYQWKIGAPVDGLPPVADATMSRYLSLTNGSGAFLYTIGGAGIQALSDNYLVMRYRPLNPNHPLYKANPTDADWSAWTTPKLAEGWIKRVLAGINPFNQRTTDLFNNQANTDASIIEQAGHRWEGDVALNADTLNNHGLIEIYETVLRRGRSLSIESGYNYGPANDALLLASGYINDLYMMLGNEAWADAANPTIGIGTKDNTYGDISTALFAFKGQEPSLLEEELALLRGRDDFLQPGVQTAPFYNRLVWNYTRGIDSGEVIYALNYNILDQNGDGKVDAADAAVLYPQAHGDAYGHYLTALQGYYSLLMNPNFDWVPRIEAVSVLGQPVSVDYMDERKFAAASAALARAGRQILDLTWRRDYQAANVSGWGYLSTNKVNSGRQFTTTTGAKTNSVRYWGMDHWASRVAQADYVNWVVGNAILPATDPNPDHEGIQKVDRTTVPELAELPAEADNLQLDMDNAEGGMTPLGLSPGSIAFDINPNQVTGTDGGTHFEQIYGRAKTALNNAVAAFDDAKDVTRLMRSEQDSLSDFQDGVNKQELAYTNELIELYGTPYTDDIGVGKLYPQGFAGPDLLHYSYIDTPDFTFPGLYESSPLTTLQVSLTNATSLPGPLANWIGKVARYESSERTSAEFTIDSYGAFRKPTNWTGKRVSPGKLQDAVSRVYAARNSVLAAVSENQVLAQHLNTSVDYFKAKVAFDNTLHDWDHEVAIAQTTIEAVAEVAKVGALIYNQSEKGLKAAADAATAAVPKTQIAGTAVGGDIYSSATAIIAANYAIAAQVNDGLAIAQEFITGSLTVAKDGYLRQNQADVIGPATRDLEDQRMAVDLDNQLSQLQGTLYTINQRLTELNDALRNYQFLVAQGDRILEERQVFRQHAAAIIQGFRTRDAAFRLFRNEKLERYKTLFDLSARYSYLAANAYDYETGLLNTDEGRAFVNRILNARALGVVRNGEPQYAGSNTGDPGLSSVLAEMKADWDAVRGRLGLNNPDAYGTTVSLRTENYRILPDTNGLSAWQNLLHQRQMDNLMDDPDVRRYCLQISPNTGSAVPGFVFEFSTTIDNGFNLFGQPLAAGDHNFSPSSFATKIFGVGVALEGYRGMDNPSANTSTVGSSGGTSPSDPNTWYLDPLALSATPYVYLVPVGEDAMRSPPLGDNGTIRSWSVDDVAIPLPFNIGASDFSTKNLYLSSDSLTEPLFNIRKHQAFRPVSSASYFSTSLYGPTGTLQRSQYTNNRLVARSVWNTKWKLIIPAQTLLQDPKAGMDRFMQTVTDIKLHFVTYSYSGN